MFYELDIDIYGLDWEDVDNAYFFKTRKEAEDFKQAFDESKRNKNRPGYIPTIKSIDYTITSISSEEMLAKMSVAELEELFNVRIVINDDSTVSIES